MATSLLVGCSRNGGELVGNAQAAETPPAPRFAAAAVDQAKAAIRAERNVVDLTFDPNPWAVTWQVGVTGVARPAYEKAASICALLRGRHLLDEHTSVRIVDLANAEAQAGNFRAGSLGRVDCATGLREIP